MQRIKLPAGCLFGSYCAILNCEDFISEIPLIHQPPKETIYNWSQDSTDPVTSRTARLAAAGE